MMSVVWEERTDREGSHYYVNYRLGLVTRKKINKSGITLELTFFKRQFVEKEVAMQNLIKIFARHGTFHVDATKVLLYSDQSTSMLILYR